MPIPSSPHLEDRIHGLDAFRAVLMLLGLTLHGALPFLDEFESVDAVLGALYPFVLVRIFRMPAFFMLAGFFGALLWKRRGARAMLRNRYQRIVLPLALFVLVLPPVFVLVVTLVADLLAGHPTPLAHALQVTRSSALPVHDFAHLWFLYHLVWIIALVALAVWWMERRGLSWPWAGRKIRAAFESPWGSVLVLGGFVLLWCAPRGIGDLPTGSGWLPAPGTLMFYALFYVLGWVLYGAGLNLRRVRDRAWTLVLVGLLCALVCLAAGGYLRGFQGMPPPVDSWGAQLARGARIVALSLGLFALTRGLMGVFLRHASSGSYFWRYISDASYTVYLLHLFPCVFLPELWVGWDAPVLVRYWTDVLLAMVCCLVVYDLCFRSTALGAFLNGRRYPRGPLGLRLVGVGVVAVGLTLSLLNHSEVSRKTAAWEARGGAFSILPLGFGLAPFGVEVPGKDDGGRARCYPAGRYGVCLQPAGRGRAGEICEDLGGRLVILETARENRLVSERFARFASGSFWISLTDRAEEGSWVWGDGTPLVYHAWHPGQPDDHRKNEDCAHGNWSKQGLWNDLPCGAQQPFVCELGGTARVAECQAALDAAAALPLASQSEAAQVRAAAERVEARCAPPTEAPGHFEAVPRAGTPDVRAGAPPAGLEGRWGFDSADFASLSDFAEPLAGMRKEALALAEVLRMALVFGAREVTMSVDMAGGRVHERVPYRVERRRDDALEVVLGGSEASRSYGLQLQGDRLEISGPIGVMRLRRSSLAEQGGPGN